MSFLRQGIENISYMALGGKGSSTKASTKKLDLLRILTEVWGAVVPWEGSCSNSKSNPDFSPLQFFAWGCFCYGHAYDMSGHAKCLSVWGGWRRLDLRTLLCCKIAIITSEIFWQKKWLNIRISFQKIL